MPEHQEAQELDWKGLRKTLDEWTLRDDEPDDTEVDERISSYKAHPDFAEKLQEICLRANRYNRFPIFLQLKSQEDGESTKPGLLKIVKLFLDTGLSPNSTIKSSDNTNNEHQSLLFLATLGDSHVAINELVSRGGDVNAPTSERGAYPLSTITGYIALLNKRIYDEEARGNDGDQERIEWQKREKE